MAVAQVSKIVLKSVGNPKAITMDENKDKNEMLLGRIIGVITGTVTRKDPTGEKEYKGLKGDFLATSQNTNVEPSRSGICYLPDFAQQPLIGRYEGPEADRPKGPVKLAVDVYAIKASNPQGYSWKLQPLIEATELEQADPLAMLEKELSAGKQKQVEAPKAAAKK